MKYTSQAVALSLAVLLSGCASQIEEYFEPEVRPDYQQMYLIGNFTWWEINPKYQLNHLRDYVYTAEVDLIADGQPYEFKFIDEQWNAGSNCGYATEKDKEVKLNQPVTANCYAGFENFQFTPQKSGSFRFRIDFDDKDFPQVSIIKI